MGARKLTRRAAVLAVSAIAAFSIAGTLGVTAATAGTTTPATYSPAAVNGLPWQYDTDDPATGANDYSLTPVNTAYSQEWIDQSDGAVCMKSTSPAGDAGIVVYLGLLDSLFSHGQYQPPVLTDTTLAGSGVEGSYNLYIDTVPTPGFYFGASAWPYVDAGGDLHGDNKFSVPFGSSTTALLGGYTDEGTLFATGTSYTLQQIAHAYAVNTAGDPRNPQVWAWFGTGDTTGTQAACISAVNGQPLTAAASPSPSPSPSSSATPAVSPSPAASSGSSYPTGGVQTGGGKPSTSPLVFGGVAAILLGVIAMAGYEVSRRKARKPQG